MNGDSFSVSVNGSVGTLREDDRFIAGFLEMSIKNQHYEERTLILLYIIY
jgi:hypothetical protein